jgi:hypothetical protein
MVIEAKQLEATWGITYRAQSSKLSWLDYPLADLQARALQLLGQSVKSWTLTQHPAPTPDQVVKKTYSFPDREKPQPSSKFLMEELDHTPFNRDAERKARRQARRRARRAARKANQSAGLAK